MSQARQFMLRINTYGPDLLAEDGTMPDYRAGVEEVITPKFQASFEQGVVAAEQTVSGAGLARTTEVFATGVSSLDADSAFFSRAIRVSGDIEAVMALHNTLEAAELTLADLLGLSAPACDLANTAVRFVRQAATAKAAWA